MRWCIFLVFLKSVVAVQDCGIALSGDRIVGGSDTHGYRYPWYALLRLNTPQAPPVCGGTLITSRHVLTAAHCFSINSNMTLEDSFTVALGVYDRCDYNEPTRKIFKVVQVFIHEKYRSDGKFYDIALLTLDNYADFIAACLPTQGVRDLTEPAYIIGFGVTEEGANNPPCHMMEANVLKYSKKDCKNSDLPAEDAAEPTVFCAGKIQGGVDTCSGDSGGPLLIKSSSGNYIIAGIVSFGYGCGESGLPGIYTDVGCYLNWILDKTKRPISKIPRNQYHQVNNYGFVGPKGGSRPNFQSNSPQNTGNPQTNFGNPQTNFGNPQTNFGNPNTDNQGFFNPSQPVTSPTGPRVRFMDNRAIPRKNPKNQ